MRRAGLVKAAVAAVASVLAALAVLWIAPKLRETKVLDTRWVDTTTPIGPATPARPSGLRKRPLSEDELQRLGFALSPHNQFDPLCFVRYRANASYEFSFPEHPRGVIRAATNEYGLRGRAPVRTDRPELRLLVIGDSHTDGVCDPAEAHPALAQDLLVARGRDAEALNAGMAGYSFSNYVGALERYLPLAPDVVVLVVYGGNDFQESLRLHHWFAGRQPPQSDASYRKDVDRALDLNAAAVGQGLLSLRYFAEHPEERDEALKAGEQTLAEFRDQCAAVGARFVLVYLPPALDVARAGHASVLDRVERELHIAPEHRGVIDELADAFLARADELGVESIDMRPILRAQERSPFWSLDFHINLEGQRLVAEQVVEAVERLCPPGFERTAPAPRPERIDATESAPEVGEGWRLRLDVTPIETRPFTPELAAKLFRWSDSQRFDELIGFIDESNSERGIGADGASRAAEANSPAVLVLGDELVSAGARRFSTELERLGVACVDASAAGHGPLNYLGALERHREPRGAIVVVWNGANDFAQALRSLRSLSNEDPKRAKEPLETLLPEELASRWHERPREARLAGEAGLRFAAELDRRAKADGARAIVVLVRPNAGRSRSERSGGREVLDRIANAFTSELLDAGVEVVDGTELQHADGSPLLDESGTTLAVGARAALARSIAAALSSK